jgi:hypothetical protein
MWKVSAPSRGRMEADAVESQALKSFGSSDESSNSKSESDAESEEESHSEGRAADHARNLGRGGDSKGASSQNDYVPHDYTFVIGSAARVSFLSCNRSCTLLFLSQNEGKTADQEKELL